MIAHDNPLPSWNDTATQDTIVRFVASVTQADGPDYVPPQERVAVFDNDGTLWCEKPMPIQADFILRRLAVMAEQNPTLRERQPWKAAYEQGLRLAEGCISQTLPRRRRRPEAAHGRRQKAFEGMSVEAYRGRGEWLPATAASIPTLGRCTSSARYAPMVELLRYLEANGFTTYIASGGDRDFMRPIGQTAVRHPPRAGHRQQLRPCRTRQTSTAATSSTRRGSTSSTTGQRSRCASGAVSGGDRSWPGGNANGDIEMLQFAGGPTRPALRLLMLHDDADREFDYVAGAERALDRAQAQEWTVVSLKNDWATVF